MTRQSSDQPIYTPEMITDMVIAEAKRQGVPLKLATYVLYTESLNFAPATSLKVINGQKKSPKGAIGAMQLVTYKYKDKKTGKTIDTGEFRLWSKDGTVKYNPYDVKENIEGGIALLKNLIDTYGAKDTSSIIAGYNWGTGNFEDYKIAKAANPRLKMPQETLDYIAGYSGWQTPAFKGVALPNAAPPVPLTLTATLQTALGRVPAPILMDDRSGTPILSAYTPKVPEAPAVAAIEQAAGDAPLMAAAPGLSDADLLTQAKFVAALTDKLPDGMTWDDKAKKLFQTALGLEKIDGKIGPQTEVAAMNYVRTREPIQVAAIDIQPNGQPVINDSQPAAGNTFSTGLGAAAASKTSAELAAIISNSQAAAQAMQDEYRARKITMPATADGQTAAAATLTGTSDILGGDVPIKIAKVRNVPLAADADAAPAAPVQVAALDPATGVDKKTVQTIQINVTTDPPAAGDFIAQVKQNGWYDVAGGQATEKFFTDLQAAALAVDANGKPNPVRYSEALQKMGFTPDMIAAFKENLPLARTSSLDSDLPKTGVLPGTLVQSAAENAMAGVRLSDTAAVQSAKLATFKQALQTDKASVQTASLDIPPVIAPPANNTAAPAPAMIINADVAASDAFTNPLPAPAPLTPLAGQITPNGSGKTDYDVLGGNNGQALGAGLPPLPVKRPDPPATAPAQDYTEYAKYALGLRTKGKMNWDDYQAHKAGMLQAVNDLTGANLDVNGRIKSGDKKQHNALVAYVAAMEKKPADQTAAAAAPPASPPAPKKIGGLDADTFKRINDWVAAGHKKLPSGITAAEMKTYEKFLRTHKFKGITPVADGTVTDITIKAARVIKNNPSLIATV